MGADKPGPTGYQYEQKITTAFLSAEVEILLCSQLQLLQDNFLYIYLAQTKRYLYVCLGVHASHTMLFSASLIFKHNNTQSTQEYLKIHQRRGAFRVYKVVP